MNIDKPRNIAFGVSVETVNPQEVYQVIAEASSQDPLRVQASSNRLKEMLTMLGTYDALQEIAVQRTLPTPIRQQAIIQFKNNALPHWRSRKVLSDEQRIKIRNRTLTLLDETDDTISECNEISIAKIARQDFPSNWPNLLNELMNVIDTSLTARYSSDIHSEQNGLVLRRSLRILNVIIREFANIKMLNGIRTMTDIVRQIRPVIHGYYTTLSERLSKVLSPETLLTERLLHDIVIAHLLYKVATKIAIWSWQRIDKQTREEVEQSDGWQADLFDFSHQQIKRLVPLRKAVVVFVNQQNKLTEASKALNAFTKYIRAYGKYFRRLHQLAPQRFVELPNCGGLVLFYWSQVVEATSGPANLIADSSEAVYPVRFLVQGMVLFKDSLVQWAPKRQQGASNPTTLSREFVENAVQLLVSRFMPLNSVDLESWLADPEEWLNTEDHENDQWEYEIRPCSERVLLQLTNHYSDYVVPLLLSTFNQSAITPAVDLENVLQKEALYCALGRCAHRLKDGLPFNDWLQHTLAVEAKESNNANYPIIKRRIAWLIGKWVSEDCASPNNPLIWDVLVHLLTDRDRGTDTVVRLTAAKALKECMDTVGFTLDYFLPHLPTAISELVRLIGEAEAFESKRKIDSTLNVVIEQAGTKISPFVPIIVEPLPQIWTSGGEDWLFKGSLLVTVTKLVEAIKEQSATLSGIVVPLVRESLAPNAIIHLDEDGLTLWLSTLRNTTTIASINGSPALSELLPDALKLLASNLDLLGKIINIIESYILLDAPGLLQMHGSDFFQAVSMAIKCDGLILNMKDLVIALELLVQVTPAAAWATHFHSSGLFAHFLSELIENEANPALLTEYVYLFARIVMADPQVFLQLITASAIQTNKKESYLMEGLLDQWWGKFDSMSEPRLRKLTAMGIASLVSTGNEDVLKRLPTEIFNLWLDVFGEIREAKNLANEDDQDGDMTTLRLYWEQDEAPRWYYQGSENTAEYDRRKAVFDQDPVRNMQLSTYVAECIRDAERNAGPELFNAYLAKADQAVLTQIQREIAR